MKKRKPLMKFLTLMLAMTLMLSMSAITAFATENTEPVSDTGVDRSVDVVNGTDEAPDPAQADVQAASAENTENLFADDADKSENVDSTVSENTAGSTDDKKKTDTADKDSGKKTDASESGNKNTGNKADADKPTDSGKGSETVKTGERDMVPVIIALAVVAVGTGTVFAGYKKKQK